MGSHWKTRLSGKMFCVIHNHVRGRSRILKRESWTRIASTSKVALAQGIEGGHGSNCLFFLSKG